MGKPNKSKNAQKEPNKNVKIEEPDFGVKPGSEEMSAGEKKLLAQKERIRKAEIEEARLAKEKLDAEKKKKNQKASTSGKTKTKQGQPKHIEEHQPVHETQKMLRNEYEGNEAASFQETQNSRNNRWPQENTSTAATNNFNRGGSTSNWRDQQKRDVSMSNNSYNNQNDSIGRSNYYYTFSDGKNDEAFQKFIHSREKMGGKVREVKGDLFTAPNDYSLAHCVAEDFSMGAGIAKEFKARFKRVTRLLDQNAKTGGLAILDDKDRFIYYLVTKAVSRGKPTLYSLWMSLLKLRDHITEHQVTKLAIPQIGCGLDRLDWIEVKRMLEYVFKKNDIEIVVYILDFNAEETPNPSKTLRKCYVAHAVQPLTDIQAETGLIFFGTEDGAVTYEMECLAKKFAFLQKYKTQKKCTGDVIRIIDGNDYLYGLIVKRTRNDKIIFADLEKCLFNLRKMLKMDKTVYIGLQGFVEQDDAVITEKIACLMQHILQDVEIWVCWPDNLAQCCPQQKQY